MAISLGLINPCLEEIRITSILLFHQLFCKLPYTYKTMNAAMRTFYSHFKQLYHD